jgi:uncharacterized protein DUF5719
MSERPGRSDAPPEAVPPPPGELLSAAPGGAAGPPRTRARAAAVALAVGTLIASGVILDRAVGPNAAALGAPAGGPSGALFCPHGGHGGWRGWVVVTNPGRRPVRVRLSQMGKEGVRSVSTFTVRALRQVYREVSADDPADVTEVEYFGGWVGAAAVVEATGDPRGVAALRCEQSAHKNWFVMDVPTGKDQTAYLVVMNPFDETAEFDVVLRTEKRRVEPGPLSPYVLAPHHSVGIPVNGYLLQGPGEESLAAQVIQRMGRVVAGGLEHSAAGVRAEAGLPAAGTRWVLPAAGDAGTRQLVVLNDGGSRADLSVVADGPAGQRLLSGPEGLSVGPDEVKTFEPGRVKDAGLLVEAANGRAVLTALRLTGPGGDSAIINGVSDTAGRWLVMPALPPSGGRGFLVLQNPGRRPVQVSFRLIGTEGPAPASIPSRVIPAGRTIRLALPSPGRRPLSAVVSAEGGTIVASAASYSSGRTAYAATLGLPMME